jgi:hypothetical protein
MGWPCLLVGDSRDAISSIINVAAESIGVQVIDICLSPSSDVSELIGCFEQLDASEEYRAALLDLVNVAVEYAMHPEAKESDRVLDFVVRLSHFVQPDENAIACGLDLASILVERGSNVGDEDFRENMRVAIDKLRELCSTKVDCLGSKSLFVWKDGPLIEAMSSGFWIHLHNVNLCPATVLDRLNPVLEPGGSLVLSECGTNNDHESRKAHRQLVPHPNFTAFLSMDPMNGEISRAMRNRCVEVSLVNSVDPERSAVDSRNVACSSGLFIPFTDASWTGNPQFRCISRSKALGRHLSSLTLRGKGRNWIRMLPLEDIDIPVVVSPATQQQPMDARVETTSYPPLRDGWVVAPLFAQISWEAQILRHSSFPALTLETEGTSILFRNVLLNRFLTRHAGDDWTWRALYLSRIESGTATALHFLAERCARLCAAASATGSYVIHNVDFGVRDRYYLAWFVLNRGPQVLAEVSWLHSLRSKHDRSWVSVLRASQLIASGSSSISQDTCPVTPRLIPLFVSLDEMCDILIDVVLKSSTMNAIVESLTCVLSTRDELWNLLETIKFTPQPSRYLHFEDDIEFIVLWTKFRKVLAAAEVVFLPILEPSKHRCCRRIHDLVEAIDSAVFGSNGSRAAARLRVAQSFPRPLVPKTSSDWSLVLNTKDFDTDFALCKGLHVPYNTSDAVDLEQLINMRHPSLFVTSRAKRDIVDANIMGRLSSLGKDLGPLADALPRIDPKVASAIQSDIRRMTATFISQMHHLKLGVDTNSHDRTAAQSDVQADDDTGQATEQRELEIRDSGLVFEGISESLLAGFARTQLSAVAQFYCERMERMNIELLCGWLLGVNSSDSVQRDLSITSLSRLVNFMIAESHWTPSEIVPHETLLWMAEASLLSNRHIVKRLLPMITAHASRHALYGSSRLSSRISPKLELPRIDGDANNVNGRIRLGRFRPGFSNVDIARGNVPDAVVFSLVGREFWSRRSRECIPGAAFFTIENFVAREGQCRALTRLLAVLDCSFESQTIHELSYKFLEILRALGASSFTDERQFVALLTTELPDAPDEIMSEIGHLVDELKLPRNAFVVIWRCLHSAWRIRAHAGAEGTQGSANGRKATAIAGAYIGLLRFHMLLPISPVDPGRRPQCEVSILNRRLTRLSIEEAACRFETSHLDPGANNETREALTRRSQISEVVSSRAKKEADIIDRPANCPSFADLYQELHDFANNIMSVDSMNEFLELLVTCCSTTSKEGLDSLVQRERHFQTTAEGFCERLLHHFAAYEDVVAPLVDSVGVMRVGLSAVTHAITGDGAARRRLQNLMNLCLRVPFEEEGISDLLEYAASASEFARDPTLERDACLAALSRLVVSRNVHGMDQKLCSLWDDAISRLMPKQNIACFGDEPDATRENDEKEIEYQRLLPNFKRAFEALCIKSDDDGTGPGSAHDDSATTTTFEDEEVELLHRIHSDFFSDASDSSIWRRAFRLSYGVAARLFEVKACETPCFYVHGYSGHALAVAICGTSHSSAPSRWRCASPNGDFPDFHRDPSPSEVSKAKLPLDRLQARVIQLLKCFPENSVLDAIAKVTDRVKKLNLLSCSVSRAMGGLEVILKNAQDWEQHASKRFQIGEPLKLLSNLIARWRKLELQGWLHLLRAREVRRESRSRKYWYQLHRLLISGASASHAAGAISKDGEKAHLIVPKWVWRGCSSQIRRITVDGDLSPVDFTEVLKVVDTFVLTATIAEFEVRLEMIRAFVRQLDCQSRVRGVTSATFLLTQSLRWLVLYYEQFSNEVADCIAKSRKPFETKLEEQSKLAKWDEQTYYSLAESSERNHGALMSILRGYDEQLDKNAAVVVDEALYSGVKGAIEGAEAVSTFPQHDEMFSCVTADAMLAQRSDGHFNETRLSCRAWVDPTPLGFGERAYYSRIAQLTRKISEVQAQTKLKPSVASSGQTQASTLSSAIFERLDSLRSGKATRPMKERALVDLVKELKRQGFAPGKWQVPAEIKSMGSIWQLPCWNLSKLSTLGEDFERSLTSCDKYIQRCLAEAPRLRHEVSVTGSRHLSLRQIETLLSLAESGLLLTIQQRCCLFLILNERKRLESLLKVIGTLGTSIPGGQSKLMCRYSAWTKDTRAAAESVVQLRIFLASMVDHVEDPGRSESIRDFLQFLDAQVDEFQFPELTEPLVVTEHDVKAVKRRHGTLDAMTSSLKKIRNDLVHVLPLGAIDGCVRVCEKSLESGLSFLDCRPDFAPIEPTSLQSYLQSVSEAVEVILISVQAWTKSELPSGIDVDEVDTVWDCHRKMLETWGSINVRKVADMLSEVVAKLKCIHDEASEYEVRDTATRLTGDLFVLVETSLDSTDLLLRETMDFHRETSKLQYVLVRLFRVLVSKGFCASPVEDEAPGNGDDPAGGTTFKEHEGIGMGEGDGIQDVTDQLESEEQLLGLKGEKDENERHRENPQQLGDEEAEQGMEMEENFDGDVFDVSKDHENDEDSNAEDNDKEELEREMGEGGLNDEVLDERMWNEDDDEGNSPQEKLEDGSNVNGAAASDEVTTKDDTAQKHTENDSEPPSIQKDQTKFETELSAEDVINDDASESHEENHGIQVSPDDADRETAEDADVMDLDDQLSLGDDGSTSKNEEEARFEEGFEEHADEDSGNVGAESGDEASQNESDQDDGQGKENCHVDPTDPHLGNGDDPVESDPLENEAQDNHATQSHHEPQTGLGVSATDGKDGVESQDFEELECQADGTEAEISGAQSDLNDGSPSKEGASAGGNSQGRTAQPCESDATGANAEANKVPNPLKHPADAATYWHRKLNVIQFAQEDEADAISTEKSPNDSNEADGKGDFEHVKVGGPETTLMLGEVDEEEVTPVIEGSVDGSQKDERGPEQDHEPDGNRRSNVDEKLDVDKEGKSMKHGQRKHVGDGLTEAIVEEQVDVESMDIELEEEAHLDEKMEDDGGRTVEDAGNQVVFDVSPLQVTDDGDITDHRGTAIVEEYVDAVRAIDGDAEAVRRSRDRWSTIHGETHHLSRRLCEKLRLVMEPLVASKLRGDYRTGKRINMKRVIGYVASGYRRDKIWLRRTKPAKRNYRVLVAVDDSESMRKSGAGEMALRAMATLAVGMSQLEVGQIGLASFGDEMRVLHPFDQPFTAERGPDLVRQFSFAQSRTRTALCVESTLRVLDTPGDHASMQLVFMISDGRIERDSRTHLRRLQREMHEKNILLALIIVEGEAKKDSILTMREVTFQKGKPVVKRFIDDYPFPYYIILHDMQSLPEVLGDALRQWFEMLARLQGR